MDQAKHEKIREEHEAARFNFISTELDLALTFCRIALSSADPGKHERNAYYAEHAYSAASYFLGRSDLSARERNEIEKKIGGLEELLEEL
jgi:hypothetical protein